MRKPHKDRLIIRDGCGRAPVPKSRVTTCLLLVAKALCPPVHLEAAGAEPVSGSSKAHLQAAEEVWLLELLAPQGGIVGKEVKISKVNPHSGRCEKWGVLAAIMTKEGAGKEGL